MSSFRRIATIPWVQKCIGFCAAEHLRLVSKTSSFAIDPPDFYDRADVPFIVAMWHGQHFMMPFFKREPLRAKVLISRHRDGEINAIAAERLGIGTIRGSGSHGQDFPRKGGVAGFRGMLEALAQGYNVALTADVPKECRVSPDEGSCSWRVHRDGRSILLLRQRAAASSSITGTAPP